MKLKKLLRTNWTRSARKTPLQRIRPTSWGLGYDDALATETAKALADGDMKKVFENQKKHIENVKKAERAAALANRPPPSGGVGITKEQLGWATPNG